MLSKFDSKLELAGATDTRYGAMMSSLTTWSPVLQKGYTHLLTAGYWPSLATHEQQNEALHLPCSSGVLLLSGDRCTGQKWSHLNHLASWPWVSLA